VTENTTTTKNLPTELNQPNEYHSSDECGLANLEHIIASVLICTSLEIICAHRNLVERNSVRDHPEKV